MLAQAPSREPRVSGKLGWPPRSRSTRPVPRADGCLSEAPRGRRMVIRDNSCCTAGTGYSGQEDPSKGGKRLTYLLPARKAPQIAVASVEPRNRDSNAGWSRAHLHLGRSGLSNSPPSFSSGKKSARQPARRARQSFPARRDQSRSRSPVPVRPERAPCRRSRPRCPRRGRTSARRQAAGPRRTRCSGSP